VFGEQAIAIAALYRLCEELFFFGIAYPVARWHGQTETQDSLFSLKNFRIDPVLVVILIALGIGISLNLMGVKRPPFLGTVSTLAMLAGTICFLVAIGMGLHISKLGTYLVPSLAVSFIKFLAVPAVITLLAMLVGLGDIEGGLPLKVVFILSCMPVAMNALILPAIFDLDLDLANACWVFTTLELVVVLPVLTFILPLL